ncbi:uncharacterized protein LOC108699584 isoform X2 [Xenopus laevis]|uniref:Uncharacterized protein LOC108699584 isoform X2 n=1 Tax=Xenopus laevis TaxID=8355 RepID=A0A8J1LIQ0_XENLA|nr:uncharacterized protein LOC108699584 isoform X2 [Xenopus laevis]
MGGPIMWTMNFQEAGKNHITKINAIANEPIIFSVDFATCFPEDISVIWRNKNSSQQVAICKEKMERSHGRFLNRIQCKKNSVTLYNLTLNDSGTFILSSTFPCKDEKEIKLFSLNVYEFLPVPHIELEQKKNTPCWCNFTLRCWVPSLAVEYTWTKREKNSGYKHYKNGSALWASLQPESWHEEYLCSVYNPAHNSCATIHVSDICPLSAPGAVTIPCNFLVGVGFWLILLMFVTGAIMVIFGSIFFKRGPPAPDNEMSMKNLTP